VTVYLSDILAGLRRRWWLALVGVLVTVAASGYVMTLVPVDQIARASVLLVPPQSVVGDAGNPYLSLNGLQPGADVLARALNSGQLHTDLAPPGNGSDFLVYRDTSSSGPVLVVEVTGTDADAVLAMLDGVLTAMPPAFQQLQEDVSAPAASIIELTTVTRDDVPEASNKGQIRAVLVVSVGGLAGTAFVAYAIDGLLLRRRLERQKAAGEDPVGTRDNPSPAAVPDAPSAPEDTDEPVAASAVVTATTSSRRDVTSPRSAPNPVGQPEPVPRTELRPEDLTRRARPRTTAQASSPSGRTGHVRATPSSDDRPAVPSGPDVPALVAPAVGGGTPPTLV